MCLSGESCVPCLAGGWLQESGTGQLRGPFSLCLLFLSSCTFLCPHSSPFYPSADCHVCVPRGIQRPSSKVGWASACPEPQQEMLLTLMLSRPRSWVELEPKKNNLFRSGFKPMPLAPNPQFLYISFVCLHKHLYEHAPMCAGRGAGTCM